MIVCANIVINKNIVKLYFCILLMINSAKNISNLYLAYLIVCVSHLLSLQNVNFLAELLGNVVG